MVGTLSDCAHDFMEPIKSFNHDLRFRIKQLINQTIEPDMVLKERSMHLNDYTGSECLSFTACIKKVPIQYI